MANTALTDLTENTSPALTDLVYLVDDPAGTPLSQKVTVQTLLNAIRAVPYTSKTAHYTATVNDEFIACNAASGAITITLPAVASVPVGKRYVIKKTDNTNNVVIDGNLSETIDGATTKTLDSQYESVVIVSTGSAWLIEAIYVIS